MSFFFQSALKIYQKLLLLHDDSLFIVYFFVPVPFLLQTCSSWTYDSVLQFFSMLKTATTWKANEKWPNDYNPLLLYKKKNALVIFYRPVTIQIYVFILFRPWSPVSLHNDVCKHFVAMYLNCCASNCVQRLLGIIEAKAFLSASINLPMQWSAATSTSPSTYQSLTKLFH